MASRHRVGPLRGVRRVRRLLWVRRAGRLLWAGRLRRVGRLGRWVGRGAGGVVERASSPADVGSVEVVVAGAGTVVPVVRTAAQNAATD